MGQILLAIFICLALLPSLLYNTSLGYCTQRYNFHCPQTRCPGQVAGNTGPSHPRAIGQSLHTQVSRHRAYATNDDYRTVPRALERLKQDFAIGVVNYHGRNRTGFNRDSYGLLRARERYLCVVMEFPWLIDSIGLISWKVEMGDVLPMIKCRIDYETRVQTICLRHYTLTPWGSTP